MTTEENTAEFLADFRAKVERETIESVTNSMKHCKICCDAEAFSEHDYSLSFCEEHQEWELVDESLLETVASFSTFEDAMLALTTKENDKSLIANATTA